MKLLTPVIHIQHDDDSYKKKFLAVTHGK